MSEAVAAIVTRINFDKYTAGLSPYYSCQRTAGVQFALVAGCRRVGLLLPGTGTSLAASDHPSQPHWVKMYALSALERGRH